MKDDYFTGLTRQVKEEVVENYLAERRIMEEQIKMIKEQADEAVTLEKALKKRVYRLYRILGNKANVQKFRKLATLPDPGLSPETLGIGSFRGLRFIEVKAFTSKGKYKKLLYESYIRLTKWVDIYAEAHEELKLECDAVNYNIDHFGEKFDLLNIISFLKGLDTITTEREHFLGCNFSSKELASVDKALTFKKIKFESFGLIRPPQVPPAEEIREQLLEMADGIYEREGPKLREIMR
jgi:hypothetical protein